MGCASFPFPLLINLFGQRRAGRPPAGLEVGEGVRGGMADDAALASRNATDTRRHHRLESVKARPSGI